MIHAEKSDLFDVLAYYNCQLPITSRIDRASHARIHISASSDKEKEFLEFILNRYTESGWEELSADRLPQLLKLKYGASISDAQKQLGKLDAIRDIFFRLQEMIYLA